MVRMSKLFGVAAAALLLAGFIGGPALAAESAGSHPGSLLLFPYFSNESGVDTYIRITNTGPAYPNPFTPEIRIHFVFFYQVPRTGQSPVCSSISSFQTLTPRDILLTNTDFEAPGATRGFFIVKATDVSNLADIKWDYLVGDEIVVNTAEGWAWAINGIGILGDQDNANGAFIEGVPNPSLETALLGEVEVALGGVDADLIEYEYINFPENFYFNYLTNRFGRATDVVFIALPRAANGTAFLGDDTTLITTTTPPFANPQTYNYDVVYWDADEREFSAPRGTIYCWDVLSVNTLANVDLTLIATRGFGWMTVFGYDNFGIATPATQRALALTLNRPTVLGITDAFAEWPAHDHTPGASPNAFTGFVANQAPPYLPTTVDVSEIF